MIHRTEVYAAIDGERDYQAERWNEKTTESKGHHSITEWLVYMQSYVNEALEVLSHTADNPGSREQVLAIVRKVAALGVVCMEEHGAPQRGGYEHVPFLFAREVSIAIGEKNT